MGKLSHLDKKGAARMVDVSGKDETTRVARAAARVTMSGETLALIRDGTAKKGDVLATARLAGIMAAKRTDELIPLCHPLPLSFIGVDFTFADDGIEIATEARTTASTGVEMEAMTSAAVAALTIYDMVKSAERGVRISGIRLTHKSGGKSGVFDAD